MITIELGGLAGSSSISIPVSQIGMKTLVHPDNNLAQFATALACAAIDIACEYEAEAVHTIQVEDDRRGLAAPQA